MNRISYNATTIRFYLATLIPVLIQKTSAKTALTSKKSPHDKMSKLGLNNSTDLVLHFPIRYENETQVCSIQKACDTHQNSVQIEGIVTACDIQYKPRRQLIVTIADESAHIVLRFLNFYPSQVKQMAVDQRLRVRGDIRHGFFGPEMVHPTCKVILKDTPLPTTLTPVYAAGSGISQNFLRTAITQAMTEIQWQDTLPLALLASLKLPTALPDFETAARLLHHPPAEVDEIALSERTHPAWIRMKFDELLAQQLSLKRAQLNRRTKNAAALPVRGIFYHGLLNGLSFTLTPAQKRVLSEIQSDINQPFPMQRLLQGDVGSGKTIVAALAAAQALDNNYQAAIMAPTEILAEQHFNKMTSWMAPLGIQIAWLTNSATKKEKETTRTLIESGHAQLIIGTHTLIQSNVLFHNLGLVIIDEQHRFGVEQRLILRNKASTTDAPERTPHQLMMSATPIPRTLAMTYYADLEVSVIDELPPGRTPILTRAISQDRRAEVVQRMCSAVHNGQQAYWVCPLIEESEALQLKTATDTHLMLTEALPDINIGLIHGRLKPAEKQAIMESFVQGTLQVLVATTVIEVGVDVPNASLMIIEHAERFGLSQLHQLRGRVGRGSVASVCVLLYQEPLGYTAKQRLMTMRNHTDGFEIARRDLAIRGPGEFLGARQSGQAMLRFTDLQTDQWLIEPTRDLAQNLLRTQPDIAEAHLARWLGRREDFLKV